jgi:hypothetical protein
MKARAVTLALFLGVCGRVSAEQKVRWVAYKSNRLNLQVSVPADWKPVQAPQMLGFRYDDLAGGTAGVGIMKSMQIGNIDDAADKELKTKGRPADWARSTAKIGGMRAVKITGTDAKDSSKRFVHYYIATPKGVYILQCQGSADRWNTFSPVFATILNKLKFLD